MPRDNEYRDVTVDVANPHRVRDFTAVAILNALAGGGDVPHHLVDRSIARTRGASMAARGVAFKGLKNIGYSIVATKAREHSSYRLAATPQEYGVLSDRIVRECYSQAITLARSLASALAVHTTDPVMQAIHSGAQMTAVMIGQRLGKSITEVVAEAATL